MPSLPKSRAKGKGQSNGKDKAQALRQRIDARIDTLAKAVDEIEVDSCTGNPARSAHSAPLYPGDQIVPMGVPKMSPSLGQTGEQEHF